MNIPINTWTNISINVQNIATECFKSNTFRSIESISITANCKIRRIFSMKNNLVENNFDSSNLSKQLSKNQNLIEENLIENLDLLPKTLLISNGVPIENININYDKLLKSQQEYDKTDNKKETDTGFNNNKDIVDIENNLTKQGNMVLSPNINSKQQTGIEMSGTNKPRRSLMSETKKNGIRSKSNNPKYLFKLNKNAIVNTPTNENKKFEVDSPPIKENLIRGLDDFDKEHKDNKECKEKINKFEKTKNKDKDKDKSIKKPGPRGKLTTKKDFSNLKLPGTMNTQILTKNKQDFDYKDKFEKQSKLLNTVQLPNNEKWDTENNETIEEIYELDEAYKETKDNEHFTPYVEHNQYTKNR